MDVVPALLACLILLVAAVIYLIIRLDTKGPLERAVQDLTTKVQDECAKNRVEIANNVSSIVPSITATQDALGKGLKDQIQSLIKLQENALGTLSADFRSLKTELSESQKTLIDTQQKASDNFRSEATSKIEEFRISSKGQLEGISKNLDFLVSSVKQSLDESQKNSRQSILEFKNDLNKRLDDQNTAFGAMTKTVGEFSLVHSEKSDQLKSAVDTKLKELVISNEKKLDDMRATVDEKLQGTLDRRLTESFKLVSDRLDTVHQGLGEMQTLASGVGDLKRVLTNVKSRGTFGEVQLGALLDDLLVRSQYEKDVKIRPKSSERVEFAIKLPGADETTALLLPIDCKFPREAFERLQLAQESVDVDGMKRATSDLIAEMKRCASDIQKKYIHPPHSTDFAIMFFPVESLYAEALRQPDLISQLQREYRVVVAGPTTLAALLNSLQMGFRTLAIQKSSSEVWKVLGGVKSEFGKFAEILESVSRQIGTAQNSIVKAAQKSRTIENRLKKVEAVKIEEHPELHLVPTAPTALGFEMSESDNVINTSEPIVSDKSADAVDE